jgi:hypothetical protein
MTSLRHLSVRPTIVVSEASQGVSEVQTPAHVGRPGPWGRSRVVYALPLAGGPTLLRPPLVVHDQNGAYLASAAQELQGRTWVWVPRMLAARFTEDTRRIGG